MSARSEHSRTASAKASAQFPVADETPGSAKDDKPPSAGSKPTSAASKPGSASEPKKEKKTKTEELSKQTSLDIDSPGAQYNMFTKHDSVLEKLKLLKYDTELLKLSGAYKPISRHYFAIPTNSGEQFFMFVSIAAWLIRSSISPSFEQPQEHDDPNAVVANILGQLREMGINVDFPPNKLKTGSGEYCVIVLDCLADAAAKKKVAFEKPAPVMEEPEDDVALEDAELTAEQFDEEEPAAAEDDDEDIQFLNLNAMSSANTTSEVAFGQQKLDILQSDTDGVAWNMEVERVAPSLKVTIRTDAKDWRNHMEQMQTYRTNISGAINQTKSQLEHTASEIGRSLDKISSREKYLNQQLEGLLSQFRTSQDRLAEVREQYKEASGGVTERSKKLAQITDELEQVKQQMEDSGNSMQAGAPLVRIKKALTILQNDILGIDVQIGVIEHSLLQSQLRSRVNIRHDMNAVSTTF